MVMEDIVRGRGGGGGGGGGNQGELWAINVKVASSNVNRLVV